MVENGWENSLNTSKFNLIRKFLELSHMSQNVPKCSNGLVFVFACFCFSFAFIFLRQHKTKTDTNLLLPRGSLFQSRLEKDVLIGSFVRLSVILSETRRRDKGLFSVVVAGIRNKEAISSPILHLPAPAPGPPMALQLFDVFPSFSSMTLKRSTIDVV